MSERTRKRHAVNRRKSDNSPAEWRFQQPGESRKEYLKRYQREYHKHEWYPTHIKERIQETKERRAALQEWYIKYKATLHCKHCGEWRSECLQFHHRDPTEKKFNISEWIKNGVSLATLQAEIAKCDVLCANCHVVETQKQHRRS